MNTFRFAAIAFAITALGAPAYAATRVTTVTNQTGALQMEDADELTHGQYIWRPDAAVDGPITINVNLARQLAYVWRGDTLIGITTVSTGRDGHETPEGVFPILQKAKIHKSTKYESAPMPFMERLTWDGVALHAGGVPDRRSSHGCIHLPATFARELFAVTKLGDEVTIDNGEGPADVDYPGWTDDKKDPSQS